MKTLIIGDIHGRSVWKLITHLENPDRVIFLGDYFDSFDFSGVEQIQNFKEIIEYKKTSGKEVILLIGNHDHHYYPEIGDTGTSGFQTRIAPSIMQVIDENREHLQMAYRMGEFVFTHAGISSEFMDSVFGKDGWNWSTMADELNEKMKYQPKTFIFNGIDGTGDNTYQTPIWIRPRSLMKANRDTLRRLVIQVVGHTQVREVDEEGMSTGNRYWFMDCLGTSGQYMVIDDGDVKINKI